VPTNQCGFLPNTGPAGPTGVISLKKIADNTYEQYGAIILSLGPGTQVTISSDFVLNGGIGSIETTVLWAEDFLSRVGMTNVGALATNSLIWSFPEGSWSTRWTGGISQGATITGTVLVYGTGTQSNGLTFSRDELSATNKPMAKSTQNPTLFVRWAQKGTGTATRAIGWADGELASDCNGLYWRHTTGGFITAVAKSGGSTTELTSSISAADGQFHAGRMVATSTSVACYLDGVLFGTITTNIPTSDLVASMGTSGTATDAGLEVDYMALQMDR
jgi:hypothetical protein